MRSLFRIVLLSISVGTFFFFVLGKILHTDTPFTFFGITFGASSVEGENIYDTIGGDFTLSQLDGTPYRLFESNNKVRLLFFGFTTCPEICPNTLSGYQKFYNELSEDDKKQTELIFVSVDPERDLPVLQSYLDKFKVPIVGLSGDVGEVDEVVKKYAAYYERIPLDTEGDYTIDHSTHIYVIAPDGRINSLVPYNAGAEAIGAAVSLLYR